MKNNTREFQVFVKPVGAKCNLGCLYCYYLQKSDLYGAGSISRMKDDILEKYITGHIEATTEDHIFFSWHGGEPTLAGLDFYKKVVSLQERHNTAGRRIMNGLQTNATLLDKEWCRFLAGNNFYVGVSIDGPGKFHNINRLSKNGKDTLNATLKGYRLLKEYNVATEILTVVNSHNADHPHQVYGFLKSLSPPFITFLPLVERDASGITGASDSSVGAEAFGKFLVAVFDEWVTSDIGSIKIQVIEEATRTAFGQDHTLCIFKERCGGVPVVEHNGDFYSCDHYVDSDHLVGNINESSLSALLDSKPQIDFGEAKQKSLPRYCLECEVLNMCNGECPKNRFITTPSGEPGLNYLCTGYRLFFNHIRPFVDAVSDEWKRNQ